jgi:hypothetical protein
MSEDNIQVCPACGVKIQTLLGGDRVLFAFGPPGTRELLWQRVCQHAKQPGCINKETGAIG